MTGILYFIGNVSLMAPCIPHCYYGCRGSFLVFNQQKKSYHHIISAAVILLGLPEMLGTMTHLELCLGFATYAQVMYNKLNARTECIYPFIL